MVIKYKQKLKVKGDESMQNNFKINYGDIINVDFGERNGSLQGGVRPAVVISNNMANNYSPVISVAPLTSQWKNNIPVHVIISNTKENGLSKKSTILIEQQTAVNKSSILNKIGSIKDIHVINQINRAMAIQFNMVSV